MKFNSVEQTLMDENRKLKNENRLLRESKEDGDYKGTFPPAVIIVLVLAIFIVGGCVGMAVASEVLGGII